MARSGEFNTTVALALLGVLASGRVGADEIRKWRDADGSLHYSITGSAEGGASGGHEVGVMSSREPSAEEKFSIEASLRRRDIERKLTTAGRELAQTRDQLREAEAKTFQAWVPAVTRDPHSAQASLDAQRDALLAASQFDHEKSEALRRLRRQERQQLKQTAELWKSFDALATEVRARYGAPPTWWRERLDCGGCPSPPEVDKALHPERTTPSAEQSSAKNTTPSHSEDEDGEEWEDE